MTCFSWNSIDNIKGLMFSSAFQEENSKRNYCNDITKINSEII